MKKVTVLGSGSGSHAMAADLGSMGNEVHMLVLPEWEMELREVKEHGYIAAEGIINEKIPIASVTTNPKEAIENSECIFCPLPAFAQNAYFDFIADYLEDEQIFLLIPGLLGTLVFNKTLENKKIEKRIFIAETSELPYSCRAKQGHVNIMSKSKVLCAAFPASDTGEVLDRVSQFYQFDRAKNVMQCVTHSTNPCYHAPGCVLNAGRIERAKGNFYLYEEGITPCVARVMEKLDEERIQIADKVGGALFTVPEEMAATREPRSIFEEINGCMSMEYIKGPESLDDRYLTEDIPYTMMCWLTIAQIAKVETPIIKAIITLAEPIIEKDIFMKGRNAQAMGIDGMGLGELIDYITN
ncbi:NAD/NADP octopine/nopaline dehydrogenase family protein [Anaerovorax odorimutans]|uniref:NAD/NADP octopine/nopaline dehydrogenase family protein n=1 Tax=Anaerovorax odorimutans TaxID=109327 RepID=A0ABT1RP88_9FIRM|nr:NAD/NADP-dependent octopine/nopaline dehydrogenase family protein [Anaerovorax odorimutans]MCQ4637002.1 NAD/NADP octopine/nopaline dehydrogenase family protein [Anaerovorax odorimutans]